MIKHAALAGLLLALTLNLTLPLAGHAATSVGSPGATAASAGHQARREEILRTLGLLPAANYRGVRVIQSTEADRTVEFREFRADRRARIEYTEQGQTIVLLLDEAAGTAFLLVPGLNLYSPLEIDAYRDRAWASLDFVDYEKLDRTSLGSIACTRYAVSWHDPEGNRGRGFAWVTDDGIGLRFELTYDSAERASEQITLELQELKVEPLANELFAMPAGAVELPSLDTLINLDLPFDTGQQNEKRSADPVDQAREALDGWLKNR